MLYIYKYHHNCYINCIALRPMYVLQTYHMHAVVPQWASQSGILSRLQRAIAATAHAPPVHTAARFYLTNINV